MALLRHRAWALTGWIAALCRTRRTVMYRSWVALQLTLATRDMACAVWRHASACRPGRGLVSTRSASRAAPRPPATAWGDDAQCEAYISAGITCATIELMSLDCHCACDSAAAVCDESVVRNGCSDPSVVTSYNLCGNSCALAVMNQWDNCANDLAVQQIMSTFANVRDYCSSGGGH